MNNVSVCRRETIELFSTFESWLVSVHRSKGLKEELLENIFGLASVINGIMAVLAGLLARVCFVYLGDIGPFQLATAITAVALGLIVFTWPEDPRPKSSETGTSPEEGERSLYENVRYAVAVSFENPKVCALGFSLAFFEGAMYTFVFMWVPALQNLTEGKGERLPIEIIFACMMVCISIGGRIYSISRSSSWFCFRRLEVVGLVIFCFAAVAKLLAMVFIESSIWVVLSCFFVFEACVGAFFAWAATMRSKYFDEGVMTTVTNVFRLPLNIIVVMGVLLTDHMTHHYVLCVCGFLHLAAAFMIGIVLKPNNNLKKE